MTKLNIVFAGTPEFGIPCLNALYHSNHHISAIYTQPDRPAGRGQKVQESAVKIWGVAHHIPIYQPLNFKTLQAIEDLEALKPDLMIVIAYGLILPTRVLEIPRFGCVNVHASLLPRWRGASPIQQAILAGDTETGVAIMQMDAGMDTGPYFTLKRCDISPKDTATSLHQRLSDLSSEPLLQTIDAIAAGTAKTVPQSMDGITYASKIKKQDAAIDWHQTAETIDCLIRAYYPWPIAFTHANDMVIRIHQASPVSHTGTQPPGTILAVDRTGILVKAAQDAMLITTIQCPGGRAISIADYLNANRQDLKIGLILQ
ncbi:MAG: methionyl-tRNA formyltransferase [Legionella sp.]|nr:MAG: methionyl-tRNA formyltransferase [Legionella sp.]